MRPRVILPRAQLRQQLAHGVAGDGEADADVALALAVGEMAVLMPITSPRMLSSGPPELPGLIAASVCSTCAERPLATVERPLEAADDADADRVREAERVADGHHPVAGLHLAESPNLISGSVWLGFSVSSMSALSVSGSRPTTCASYSSVVVLAVQRDGDLGGAFDDVVVGEDEAGLVDDEAGAGGLHHLLALRAALRPGPWPPWPPCRRAGSAGRRSARRGRPAAAAAEEVGQVLRALPRLGADVHDRRRRQLGDVAEGGGA